MLLIRDQPVQYHLRCTLGMVQGLGCHSTEASRHQSYGCAQEDPEGVSHRNIKYSLHIRRISGASAIEGHACEAQAKKNPPVVTPLFMLLQPFALRTVFADWLLWRTGFC